MIAVLKKSKPILVRCPKCKTRFIRPENEIKAGERCGICLNDVVMVPAPITKEEKTKLLGALKKKKSKK